MYSRVFIGIFQTSGSMNSGVHASARDFVERVFGSMPFDDHVFEYFLHLPTPCMGFRLYMAESRIPGLSNRRRSLPAMPCGARLPTHMVSGSSCFMISPC